LIWKDRSWYSGCRLALGIGRTWCIFTWWLGSASCWSFSGVRWRGAVKNERENEKKRLGCVDENTAVREREVRMVAGSSGGIQIHVDAAQSGVHYFSTHSHPSYLPTPISYHPPNSPFDTGSGVPIDLDRLKTRRNHRRQLLRTPLSGMSCGRIGVGEILAREVFCRWMSNDALSSVQLLKVDRKERCGDDCNGKRVGSWNRRSLSTINKILDDVTFKISLFTLHFLCATYLLNWSNNLFSVLERKKIDNILLKCLISIKVTFTWTTGLIYWLIRSVICHLHRFIIHKTNHHCPAFPLRGNSRVVAFKRDIYIYIYVGEWRVYN